jgi:hypothetical protein
MEGLIEFLFKSVVWLISQFWRGKLPKVAILAVVVPTILTGVVGWLFYENKYNWGSTKWERVACLPFDEEDDEKPVKLLSASPQSIRVVTNYQRTYEVQPWYGGVECEQITESAPQTWQQIESCETVLRLRVSAPPGKVIERAAAEDCGPPTRRHTEYVILENSSLWYWQIVTDRDIFTCIFFACIGAAVGFLIGVGILWGLSLVAKVRGEL